MHSRGVRFTWFDCNLKQTFSKIRVNNVTRKFYSVPVNNIIKNCKATSFYKKLASIA